MSFFSALFGDGEARKGRELELMYDEFEWKAKPLLVLGEMEKVQELFVSYTVGAQMKNPGDEGEILLEFDRIVKELMRKPRENVRRGLFRDI